MHRMLGLWALCLAACAAPVELPDVSPELAARAWNVKTAGADIVGVSCPEGAVPFLPEQISLVATPVELGGELEGLTYVGGWNLTSDDPRFGGLSGLDVQLGDHLLAVSDQGHFVQLLRDGDGWAGHANIWAMRGADGTWLDGKTKTDAEGLVFEQGLALVSFERDHRILGYALDHCGEAARGVEIAKLPAEQAGKVLDPNKGAEALSLSADGELTFGYETGPGNGMPLGAVYGDRRARFVRDAVGPGGYGQVGRDELGDTVAELFRSYDPIRGNRNVIRIGEFEARMAKPMTVDNFEGIALQELPGGGLRIWIISDDNFNPKQRTLLMAFDVQEQRNFTASR